MEFKPLYKAVFSQIRPASEFDPDVFSYIKRRRNIHTKLILAAAVIALLAGLCVTAYAANLFGLRDLLLTGGTRYSGSADEPKDIISLSGFADTAETQANAEWQAFLKEYDSDGSILAEIGNGIYEGGDCYRYYLVYTREMADKLDEIAAKYGLELHSYSADNISEDELRAQVGGDFLGEHRAYGIYMYEDGTFAFDGEADIDGYGLLDYQFLRCVRGSMTATSLSLGDVNEYTEWQYTTSSGIAVSLALAPHKALVIAALDDSFVTINVLAGTETAEENIFSSGPITADVLESFADGFDFARLTPAHPLDLSMIGTVLPEDTDETFYNMTGIYESDAQSFYAQFVGYIESGERQAAADMLLYPALLTVPSGTFLITSSGELLEYYDDIFPGELLESIKRTRYDNERADLITADGMVGAADGAIWFGKSTDGRLRIITVQNSGGWSVRYSDTHGRPEKTSITYSVEGIAENIPATLYQGSGYSLYIPDWLWKRTEENTWECVDNGSISFSVKSYADPAGALINQLTAEGYLMSETGDYMTKYDDTSDIFHAVRIFEDTSGIKTFVCSYPIEAAEGFGSQLYAIADTFAMEAPKYRSAFEAYASVLDALLYEHILPDGSACEPNIPMDLNRFALCDVNGDGNDELILLFTDTYTAGQAGYVISYSEAIGDIRIELSEFPMLTLYANGLVTAGWSHNQGAAGDSLWPYTLYSYDAEDRCYKPIAKVDAWDRTLTETYQGQSFPIECDRSGTGVVYYIMPPDSYDISSPMDVSEYDAWLSSRIGDTNELELEYMNLTAENRDKIRYGK